MCLEQNAAKPSLLITFSLKSDFTAGLQYRDARPGEGEEEEAGEEETKTCLDTQ